MGYAACQPTYGLHLRSLLKLFFKLPVFSHVTQNTTKPGNMMPGITYGGYGNRDLSSGSILSQNLSVKSWVNIARSIDFVVRLIGRLYVGFIHEPEIVHSEQFFPGVPYYLAQGIVDECKVSLEISLVVPVGDGFQNSAVLFLTFAERFFCLLPLGNVSGYTPVP